MYFVVVFAFDSNIPSEVSAPTSDTATDMESCSGSKLPVLQTAVAIAASFAICKTATWLAKLFGIKGGDLLGITAIVVILATVLPTHFGYLAPAGDFVAVVLMQMLEWSRTYVPNIAGEIAFVIALAMWVTSYPRVRRKMFEVFFYTHHIYTLYIFFYALHVGVAYLCMILPDIFLFLIYRYLRFLQSTKRARLVAARLLPCGAFELNFSKRPGLNFNPTSILFVNVPRISKLQRHPFTVTSNCNMEADWLSITTKCGGSWTQRLYQELSSSVNHLQVSVEGPYWPASSHFLRRESLVMVSGSSSLSSPSSRSSSFKAQNPTTPTSLESSSFAPSRTRPISPC